MHYCINLVGLMSMKERDPIGALLFPASVLGSAVTPEKRSLGTEAVMLTCPPERAEAIVGIVRKKYTKQQFLIHASKTGKGGWKRV